MECYEWEEGYDLLVSEARKRGGIDYADKKVKELIEKGWVRLGGKTWELKPDLTICVY